MASKQREELESWTKRLQECEQGTFNPTDRGIRVCRAMIAYLEGRQELPLAEIHDAMRDKISWETRFVGSSAVGTLLRIDARPRASIERAFARAPARYRSLALLHAIHKHDRRVLERLLRLAMRDPAVDVRSQLVISAAETMSSGRFLKLAARMKRRERSRRVQALLNRYTQQLLKGYFARHDLRLDRWQVWLNVRSHSQTRNSYNLVEHVPTYAVEALGLPKVVTIIRQAHWRAELPIPWRVKSGVLLSKDSS